MNKNFSTIIDFREIIGTSFHGGYICESAENISKVLGEYYKLNDEKTSREWDCRTASGTPFTVYDYKNGYVSPKRKMSYHIGTKSKEDTEFVVGILKNCGLNAYVE